VAVDDRDAAEALRRQAVEQISLSTSTKVDRRRPGNAAQWGNIPAGSTGSTGTPSGPGGWQRVVERDLPGCLVVWARADIVTSTHGAGNHLDMVRQVAAPDGPGESRALPGARGASSGS
jgi:hypothetical protein